MVVDGEKMKISGFLSPKNQDDEELLFTVTDNGIGGYVFSLKDEESFRKVQLNHHPTFYLPAKCHNMPNLKLKLKN